MSPTYSFVARNREGRVEKGSRQAATRKELLEALSSESYVVVDVKEQGIAQQGEVESIGTRLRNAIKKKVSSKEYMIFCRQFATMVGAGMTVLHTMEVLAEQVANPDFKWRISNVTANIRRGTPLAEAFGRESDFFPSIMINMIEAGEAAGILEEVLDRLAVHFEKQNDLEQKIKSAITYPIILGVVAVAVLCAMIFFVLPQFATVFEQMGVDLPWLTVAVLGISEITLQYWYLVLLALVLAIYGLVVYLRTEKGAYNFDLIRLKLPLFGSIYRRTLVARFSRTLSTLMNSGVELLNSLELVEGVLNNRLYSGALKRAREVIRQGQPMAPSLMASGLFPAMLVEMVQVGEDTGSLDIMLSKNADMYETEVGYELDRLASIIEPVLIVVVGVMVAIMVAAVILPMFQTYEML